MNYKIIQDFVLKVIIAFWLATALLSIPAHMPQSIASKVYAVKISAPPIKPASVSTSVPEPTPPVATQSVEPVAVVPAPVPVQTAPQPVELPASPVYASHNDLMAAAGIDPSNYSAVDYIVSHESSWNENATEPTTGAHGLVQALPYSKTDCDWVDAVCQLRWASSYAVNRYGSWQGAYTFWVANRYW